MPVTVKLKEEHHYPGGAARHVPIGTVEFKHTSGDCVWGEWFLGVNLECVLVANGLRKLADRIECLDAQAKAHGKNT